MPCAAFRAATVPIPQRQRGVGVELVERCGDALRRSALRAKLWSGRSSVTTSTARGPRSRRLLDRSPHEQPEFRARSPRSTARSTSTHSIPRACASTLACGLIVWAARIHGSQRTPDRGEYARDSGSTGRPRRSPDALDLDRHPAVVPRGTSDRPGRCRSAIPAGRAATPPRIAAAARPGAPAGAPRRRPLRAPTSSSGRAHLVRNVRQDLGQGDLETILAGAGPLADEDRARPARPAPRSPSVASSSSEACSPPLSAYIITLPSALTMISRSASGRPVSSLPE